MAIPFFTKCIPHGFRLVAKIEYYILIFNTDIPKSDIYQHTKILKGVGAFIVVWCA